MRLSAQFFIIALITLVLAEAGARLFLPQPGLQPFPPNQPVDLLVQDAARSYAYRPGFSGKVHEAPHTIDVSINALGMRDEPVLVDERIDILAIGDSFTVGYMVRAAEAWPERLEHYLRESDFISHSARVLNAGVSGYSLKQIRLTAEKYAGLEPAMVIAGVLPFVADRLVNPYQWHEGYAIRAQKIPFLKKVKDGFLTAVPHAQLSPKQQFWLMQNFRIGATVWLAIRDWRSTNSADAAPAALDEAELSVKLESEIRTLHELTKLNGQQLVIILIGFQQADGSFDAAIKNRNLKVRDFCVSQGIPVFDPTQLFEAHSSTPVFRISDADYHWTPLAHDIAAAGLASYLASQKEVRLSSQ